MSRTIDLYVIRDNAPVYLTGYVSKVLGYPLARSNRGMAVNGCGMNMIFHCVYSLARALFCGVPIGHEDFESIVPNGSKDTGYLLRSEQL
jgi:hypothetical protein